MTLRQQAMRDVSAQCELSETYYGMIERGQRRPSLDVLLGDPRSPRDVGEASATRAGVCSV